MKAKHRFIKNDLTVEEFSFLLNTPFSRVIAAIENPMYVSFNIPKKTGGVRLVSAPSAELKGIQHSVNKKLRSVYHMVQPKHVHGFTYKTAKEKYIDIGIKANAKMHINKKCVLNIDIKDFFQSITITGVRNAFIEQPFNYSINTATGIALLLCYKGGLPTGAPTSPLISNLYCLQMDAELLNLCTYKNITYSRYADDLSFSSDEIINNNFIEDVASILHTHGFEINKRKLRQASDQQAQYVTGIKVNQKLNVNRIYYRNLRAVLHSIETQGISDAMLKYKGKSKYKLGEEHKFLASVRGRIEYIGYIRESNDILYRELKLKFKDLLGRI